MKQKAFTLIELLVVIAIIGVISSIVLVNLSGSREKATIARGLSFSQSVNHALGAYAVGVWSFDKYQNPITDTSGYGNNCTVYGAIEVEGIIRKALYFDGTDDYLNCGTNINLQPINGTIAAWIYGEDYSGVNVIFTGSTGGTVFRHPYFKISDSDIAIKLTDNIISESHNYDANLQTNKWYYVAVTWDGTNVSFYVDGNLKKTDSQNFIPAGNTNLKRIGALNPPGFPESFNGIIDEVRIYNEALVAGEIQKHYVEGLGRHKDLTLKDQ